MDVISEGDLWILPQILFLEGIALGGKKNDAAVQVYIPGISGLRLIVFSSPFACQILPRNTFQDNPS